MGDRPRTPRRKRYRPPDIKQHLRPGRPWIKVDLDAVKRLAGIGCTDEEIADIIGCTREWVSLRKKDYPDFSNAIKTGRADIRRSLRRAQLAVALGEQPSRQSKDGVSYANPTGMLVWLGKQLLAQRQDPPPERESEQVAESMLLGLDIGTDEGRPIVIRPGATVEDARHALGLADVAPADAAGSGDPGDDHSASEGGDVADS